MNKIKTLFQKYKEMLLYLLFGVLTTVVNYIVYFSAKALGLNYQLSTVLAWILAVAFAYITNRIWVFESKSKGAKAILKEIVLFVAARLFSLLLELLIMYIGMDLCNANEYILHIFTRTFPMGEFITKTVAQIVVILANYIASKRFVFCTKR